MAINNSSIDSSNEIPDTPYLAHLLPFGQLMLAFIGIPANIFVLWLGVQLSKKLGAHNSQRIIVSMTSADLLFCSLYLPFQGVTAILRVTAADWLCYAVNYVALSGMIASSLSLLLLNVDKFFSISRPLHYKLMITNRKLSCGIAVVWLVANTWIALLLFGPWTHYAGCVFRPQEISYLSMFCLFYVSPIAISFVISVYVWAVVAKAKRDDRQRKLNWTVSKTSSLNDTGGARKSSSSSTRRKRIRSILFVFSTTIWSALTLLPYRLGYILITLEFVSKNQAVYALLLMLLLNSVGNPFITMFTQRQYYRMALKTVCIDCLHMRVDRFIVDYGGTLRETSNSSFSQGTLIEHRANRPMSSSERRRGNPERRLMRRSTDWILGADDEETSTRPGRQHYLSIPTPL